MPSIDRSVSSSSHPPGGESGSTRSADHSEHRTRITVDLDGYAPRFRFKAVSAYHSLERWADDVTVAISSSGNGLHLVGWFRESLTFAEEVRLRRTLGDDPKRVEIDIERALNGIYTGVLWSEKSASGSKQRGFADVYDALEAMDGAEALSVDRVKAYANDGHKAAPEVARLADDPR